MFLSFFSGLFIFCSLLALSIVLLVRCRLFYHILIGPLHIAENSGLSTEIILRNYDCLIDYCSPFYSGKLAFPDFPSSASALSHFAETKRLFGVFYLAVPLCILSAVLLIAFDARMHPSLWFSRIRSTSGIPHPSGSFGMSRIPKNVFRTLFLRGLSSALKAAGFLCLLVPSVCLLFFLTSFHQAFWLMHQVFFRNNDWLFDARTDPVITILPERYFLCCGVAIVLQLILFAFVIFHFLNKSKFPKKIYFAGNTIPSRRKAAKTEQNFYCCIPANAVSTSARNAAHFPSCS